MGKLRFVGGQVVIGSSRHAEHCARMLDGGVVVAGRSWDSSEDRGVLLDGRVDW